MIQLMIPLSQAADPTCTPSLPGVYILYLHGQLMKVGSAEIGIQKRMQQYYGLNPCCGLNRHINSINRDWISVSYQLCEKSQCRELESKLFDKYGGPLAMPWADRRPNADGDTCALLI